MAFDYTCVLRSETEESFEDFDIFTFIWMGVADIVTKHGRKRWTIKSYANNLEFAFKKERDRDRFNKRAGEILIALREGNHEVLCALLPPKTYSRP